MRFLSYILCNEAMTRFRERVAGPTAKATDLVQLFRQSKPVTPRTLRELRMASFLFATLPIGRNVVDGETGVSIATLPDEIPQPQGRLYSESRIVFRFDLVGQGSVKIRTMWVLPPHELCVAVYEGKQEYVRQVSSGRTNQPTLHTYPSAVRLRDQYGFGKTPLTSFRRRKTDEGQSRAKRAAVRLVEDEPEYRPQRRREEVRARRSRKPCVGSHGRRRGRGRNRQKSGRRLRPDE